MINIVCMLLIAGLRTQTHKSEPLVQFNSSDLTSLSWRSIGPANMGGRVSDVTFDPSNPKTFFVAFATGGIWETTDMGSSFKPIFDHYSTASIGSVSIVDSKSTKKSNAAQQTVWVGTGEGNGRNSSSWGDGVYRSTNGGKSFEHVGLEDSRDIPRIAADPTNPDICYAAALGHLWGPNKMRGVYKTTDGGKSWKPVLQIDDKTGAVDVILDPKNPRTIYAAMYQRLRTAWSMTSGGPEGGIYKSTDAGDHWSKLTNGLPSQTGRIGLDVSQSNPNIVMALVESDTGGSSTALEDDRSKVGGVFRSEDGGNHWVRTSVIDPRAFYFSKIRINPKNPQQIYVVGWDVTRSDDGGHTFTPGFSRGLHSDWHAMAIDPTDPEHIIAGCDGGLFQTIDAAKDWDCLNLMAEGEFYDIGTDTSTPFNIVGGLQDNGSWMGPSATRYYGRGGSGIAESDWHPVGGGDGFHAGFDPQDSNIVYTESQGGSIGRINLTTGEYRNIQPVQKEGQPNFRFNWNAPFVVSVHEPGTVYLGGNEVFKLSQQGNEWQAISPDLTTMDPMRMTAAGSSAEAYCTIVALSESPTKQGLIWSGSDDGLIQVTTNDGGRWQNVTPKLVDGNYVAMIEASHIDSNRAYAAIDAHRADNYDPMVLETDDLGKTWTNISGNLPKGASVRCITDDLRNPNVLYVGTETGIYMTVDRGKNWVNFNNDKLPVVSVQDILIEPKTYDMVIATHGRSIWILDDVSAVAGLTPEIVKSNLHVFEPNDAKPIQPLDDGGPEGARSYSGENPKLGAYFDYWLGKGGETQVVITNSKGDVVNTLQAPGNVGLNRLYWDMHPDRNLQMPNRGQEAGEVYVTPGVYTVTFTRGNSVQVVKIKINPGVNSSFMPTPSLVNDRTPD